MRALGVFWVCLLMALGVGAGVLQWLGPVAVPGVAAVGVAAAGGAVRPPVAGAQGAVAANPHGADPHGAVSPGAVRRVAGPDSALLERAVAPADYMLPRVGADGRMARVVYAAPASVVAAGVPRVALLVAGFGASERDSRAALEALPGAVSFAVSAYGGSGAALLEAARAGGHELLASIPMEPQGFPTYDAGPRQLLTGLSAVDNRQYLEWALGRTAGAVGATGASDGMRGERFAEVAGAFDPVLDEIARRGLLYVDPRPGRAPSRPGLVGRAVDVVLDEPPGRAEIVAALRTLERIAREKGSAVGLVGLPRPGTVERLGEWTRELQGRGLVLVPVSALAEAPR